MWRWIVLACVVAVFVGVFIRDAIQRAKDRRVYGGYFQGVPEARAKGVAEEAEKQYPGELGRFFHVLAQVESGGNPHAVGDGGTSRGMYQIGRAYWKDGMAQLAREGRDRAVRDCETYLQAVWWPEACEQIVWAYMRRYDPVEVSILECQAGQFAEREVEAAAVHLARVHNGGPSGALKKATERYGARFRRVWRATPK